MYPLTSNHTRHAPVRGNARRLAPPCHAVNSSQDGGGGGTLLPPLARPPVRLPPPAATTPEEQGDSLSSVIECEGDDEQVIDPAVELAKQLTREIKSAPSPVKIMQLLRDSASFRSVRHLSTALFWLCRLQNYYGKKSERAVVANFIANELVEEADDGVDWSNVTISNILDGYHKLQLSNPELLQRVYIELCRPGRQFCYKTLSAVLNPMAKLGFKIDSDPFLCTLDELILDSTTQKMKLEVDFSDVERLWSLPYVLTEIQCSTAVADAFFEEACAYGLHRLHLKLLCYVVRLVAERGSIEQSPRALAHICRAIVLAADTNPGWDEPSENRSIHSLCLILNNVAKMRQSWAASEWGCDDFQSNAASVVDAMQTTLPEMPRAIQLLITSVKPLISSGSGPRNISVLANAFASLGAADDVRLLTMLAKRATRLAGEMTAWDLALIARSFANLRYDNPIYLEAAATALLRHSQNPVKSPSVNIPCMSAMLYALAVLNRFEGAAAQRLLPVFAHRIAVLLPSLVWDGTEKKVECALPLLGWSLLLAKGAPDHPSDCAEGILQALRAWRGAIVAMSPRLLQNHYRIVHHVDVALGIECPDLGRNAPSQFDTFFNSLYDSGRLTRTASLEWEAQKNTVVNSSSSSSSGDDNAEEEHGGKLGSRFQHDVHNTACSIVPGWEFEHWEDHLCYTVDLALPAHRVAIEVDGPTHYTLNNTERLCGHTLLKRRLLRQLGWHVVHVPYFEWTYFNSYDEEREQELRKSYLVAKIDEVLSSSGGIEALIHRVAHPNDQVEVEEEDEDEEGVGVVEPPSSPPPSPSPPPPPVVVVLNDDDDVVAQRARNLDVLKLRQGKLTKQGLAVKVALRNVAAVRRATQVE